MRTLIGPAALLALSATGALGAPLLEDAHVLKWPKGPHGYRGSMGDIVQLKDGSLLMSYTREGLMAVRSTDGGKTWGEPAPLLANPQLPKGGYYCHPSFLRLKDGNLLLSYIYGTYPVTPYYGHNYFRLSADEGKTWSDQFIMTPYPGYVLMHNGQIFTLSTGRIMAMAEYKAYRPSSDDHGGYVGISFFSDNGGLSWYPSKNTVDMQPIEVQEAAGVELKDGRVMMFARTYSGHPVRAYSSDGGETWSKGEEMKELSMPYAGLPSVVRIPKTGDLLFIWISGRSVDAADPKINRRCTLTAAISRDEGRTFEHQRNIVHNPEDDFGYQCIEFLEDGTVLVGYHARDGIHVARIATDWFYGRE